MGQMALPVCTGINPSRHLDFKRPTSRAVGKQIQTALRHLIYGALSQQLWDMNILPFGTCAVPVSHTQPQAVSCLKIGAVLFMLNPWYLERV